MITYKMLNYPVTSEFGHVGGLHKVPHTGIDIATPAGTPAQSLTAGTIESITTNDPFLGASVRVDTGNGTDWVYGHLSQVNAIAGQTVSAGDVLGLTGGTPGTVGAGLSTGAHLHLAALQNGAPMDPALAIQGNGALDRIRQLLPLPADMLAPKMTITDRIFEWLGNGIELFVQAMPELCGLLAMVFILGGMTGWKKGMNLAGTCTLLAIVGVLLNAAKG